uniref:Uncharacterized protein n=1 Tax=Anguilla anguilla TaxID=7936 RepID=A0A0E9URZ2_ANGAN
MRKRQHGAVSWISRAAERTVVIAVWTTGAPEASEALNQFAGRPKYRVIDPGAP